MKALEVAGCVCGGLTTIIFALGYISSSVSEDFRAPQNAILAVCGLLFLVVGVLLVAEGARIVFSKED